MRALARASIIFCPLLLMGVFACGADRQTVVAVTASWSFDGVVRLRVTPMLDGVLGARSEEFTTATGMKGGSLRFGLRIPREEHGRLFLHVEAIGPAECVIGRG